MSITRIACVLSASLLAGCLDGDQPGREALRRRPVGAADDGGSLVDNGTYDEPLVLADPPPPPVSGGTLLAIAQGHKAAVADPDHDQVLIVDLDTPSLVATIALQAGDEPGRLVEDGAGRLHVSLRSGGAVATIDPSLGTILRREEVCSYPRGLAYDATADTVVVACAGGELVTLPAAGGTATRSLQFTGADGRRIRDLRDVVIDGERLLVSRFRSAELLVIDADGSLSATLRPKFQDTFFEPAVAWRTIAAPGGGVIMVHQLERITDVEISPPGGYAGSCKGGIVRTAVSVIRLDGSTWSTPVPAVLPVDLALTNDSNPMVHVAAAGARADSTLTVVILPAPLVEPPPMEGAGVDDPSSCGPVGSISGDSVLAGQAVAVAPGPNGQVLIQTLEPATLLVNGLSVPLPGVSRKDSGHDIFHLATNGGLACASCHPEGREDGHAWRFAGLGPRRTQSVAGGILGTEPFHWGGDMKDFSTLAHDVFNHRMSGPSLEDGYVSALAKWIDSIPLQKSTAPRDAAAVERGRTIFNDPATACATCHAGVKMTNNTTVDVGTGGLFQVPSLRGLVWRTPLMHDGCALTVNDRFGDCGGGKHGPLGTLDAGRKADLVSYLESL